MDYRQLGQTSLLPSILSFGTATFGDAYGDIDTQEAYRAVDVAIEQGINYFDTAPYYGNGTSETLLGKALKGKRDEVILATKAGQGGLSDTVTHDMSANAIRRSVELSLKRLKTDWIDLCQLHDMDMDDPQQIIHESLPVLLDFKRAGKIRYIGITAYTIESLLAVARQFPVDMMLTFCHYDLLDTTLMDELLPFTEEHNIGLINASPLHMGVLTDDVPPPWHPVSDHVREAVQQARQVCAEYQISLAELALQFALQNQRVTSTLIGFKTSAQVHQNIKIMQYPINHELLQAVQAIFKPVMNIPLITR